MVNKERVRLLVEALNSGEFEQIYGKLKEDNGYCCLGVACVVAIRNGLEVEEVLDNGDYLFDGEDSVLPRSVNRWYGFDVGNPAVGYGDHYDIFATTANDELAWVFPDIAEGFKKTYLDDNEN